MAVALQSSPVVIGNPDGIEEGRPKSGSKGEVKFQLGEGSPQRTAVSRSEPSLMAPIKRENSGNNNLLFYYLFFCSIAINLTIFTIDLEPHKICFQTGRRTTAGEIVKEMIARLDIPEEMSNVFSIWMVSKHLRM